MATVAAAMPTNRRTLPLFFLLTFGISWGFWLPLAAESHGLISLSWSPILTGLLGAFAPSLAAVIVTLLGGGSALRALLGRLLIWRVGIQWYAFVIFYPAALSLAKTAIYVAFGGSAPDFANPPVLSVYPVPPEAFTAGPWVLVPIIFLQQMLLGSSMGEELGWRGLLLPRLQNRMTALNASLIIGVVWGVWHLPKFFMKGDPLAEIFFPWFLLGIVANAILYTWVYNNTQGSLLLPLLFHTSTNITFLFLAAAGPSPLISLLVQWMIVTVIIVWAGAERLSRKPV
jgi:uncharacterized protein